MSTTAYFKRGNGMNEHSEGWTPTDLHLLIDTRTCSIVRSDVTTRPPPTWASLCKAFRMSLSERNISQALRLRLNQVRTKTPGNRKRLSKS